MMSSKKESNQNQSFYMAEPKNEEYFRRLVDGIVERRLREKSYIDVLPSKMESLVTYLIKKEGTSYKVINGTTGSMAKSSTNALTSIQWAHDNISVAGRILLKGNVDFEIDGPIEISKPIRLGGEAHFWTHGTRLTLANGVDDNMIEIDGNGTHIYFPQIDNLMLHGNKANNSSTSHGIYFIGDISDAMVYNVGITQMADRGIFINSGWYMTLDKVWAEYCDDAGFYTNAATRMVNCTGAFNLRGLTNTNVIQVDNSRFQDNDRAGIWTTNANGKMILSNSFIKNNSQETTNTYDGVKHENGYLNMSNCVIDGQNDHKYGLEIKSGADGLEVTGCTFLNNQTADWIDDGGALILIEGVGYETANAEEPQAAWRTGAIVDFIDSGDGSGDGVYLLRKAGTWIKIG